MSNIKLKNATELVPIQEGLYLCVHAKLLGAILRGAPDHIFQETEGGNVEMGLKLNLRLFKNTQKGQFRACRMDPL